jgi:hypothetical protein
MFKKFSLAVTAIMSIAVCACNNTEYKPANLHLNTYDASKATKTVAAQPVKNNYYSVAPATAYKQLPLPLGPQPQQLAQNDNDNYYNYNTIAYRYDSEVPEQNYVNYQGYQPVAAYAYAPLGQYNDNVISENVFTPKLNAPAPTTTAENSNMHEFNYWY